jgi:hypothetical protein
MIHECLEACAPLGNRSVESTRPFSPADTDAVIDVFVMSHSCCAIGGDADAIASRTGDASNQYLSGPCKRALPTGR